MNCFITDCKNKTLSRICADHKRIYAIKTSKYMLYKHKMLNELKYIFNIS